MSHQVDPATSRRAPAFSRRALLGAGGACGLLVVLTACGAGATTPTPSPTTAPPPTPPPSQIGPPLATGIPVPGTSTAASPGASLATPRVANATMTAMPRATSAMATGTTPRAASASVVGGTTVTTPTGAPAGVTGSYVADFARWPRQIKAPPFPFPVRTSYDPAGDEYRIGLLDTAVYNYFAFLPEERRFGDFRLEVALRCLEGGDRASYGVVVGAQPPVPGAASYEYHGCLLRAGGLYTVLAVPTSGKATSLAPNTPTPAVAPAPEWNRLVVEVRQGQLTLAANDLPLGSWPVTIPGLGAIGLYAGNSNLSSQQIATQAGFTKLRITPL
jgi:hypothetical protein